MRFHVHAHVDNLQASIAFYSRMFGAQPVRVEADYAKWHLEIPRLNFAISTRGSTTTSACCAPLTQPAGIAVKAGSSCC